MGFAVSQPTIISPTPSAAPNVITVCSVRLISSRLFCPMSSASTAIRPDRQSDDQVDKNTDERHTAADRRQRRITRKPADNGHIC